MCRYLFIKFCKQISHHIYLHIHFFMMKNIVCSSVLRIYVYVKFVYNVRYSSMPILKQEKFNCL